MAQDLIYLPVDSSDTSILKFDMHLLTLVPQKWIVGIPSLRYCQFISIIQQIW